MPEASQDGKIYGRKDGAFIEITPNSIGADVQGAAGTVYSALLDDVAAEGNTLKKLYDLICSLFSTKQDKLTTSVSHNSTFTLALTDQDKVIRCNSATDMLFNIDTYANVAIPVGTAIEFVQDGAGVVTVTGLSGVTIIGDPKTQGQTKWAAVHHMSLNIWEVIGGTT
jgi:hypothetical protein